MRQHDDLHGVRHLFASLDTRAVPRIARWLTAVSVVVVCVSCEKNAVAPAKKPPLVPFGGGVPIQTVMESTWDHDQVYILLDKNAPGANIKLEGPVEIWYGDPRKGAAEFDIVYVPAGSWDCVCQERGTQIAEYARPIKVGEESETDPYKRIAVGPLEPICRPSPTNTCPIAPEKKPVDCGTKEAGKSGKGTIPPEK